MRKQGLPLIAAAAWLAAVPAQAADAALWTLYGGYTRSLGDESGDSADVSAYSMSLERRIGLWSIGAGGGYSARNLVFERSAVAVNADGWSVSGWIARPLAGVEASAGLDYFRETGAPTLVGDNGATLLTDARSAYLTASLSAARSFGGATRLRPAASLSWSEAETDFEARLAAAPAAGFALSSSSSGVSGSLGATLAHDLSPGLTAYLGAAAVAAEDTAAVYQFVSASASSGPRSFGDGSSDVWGEFSAGLSATLGATTIGVDATFTEGLADDALAVSASASLSF